MDSIIGKLPQPILNRALSGLEKYCWQFGALGVCLVTVAVNMDLIFVAVDPISFSGGGEASVESPEYEGASR